MKKHIIRFLTVLAVFSIVGGCGGGDNGGQEETAAEEAAGEKDSGKVLAVVEGEDITAGLLAERVDEMKMSMGGRMNPAEMARMEDSFRSQAFSNLVNFQLLMHEADEKGITVADSELQERTDEIVGSYDSEEQFYERISQLGMNREAFESRLTKQIRIDKLIEMETSSMEAPTGEEVREYYDSNSAQFEEPEQVRASHILIKVDQEDDEESRQAKKEKLQGILNDIRNGASFAEQASLYSEGPTKSKGGDLGFFGKGDMVEPFSNAAFSMEIGEVSDIVETRYGYHIIKVTDRKQARTVPFDEVQDRISGYLESNQKNEAINEYLTRLREEADIQYYDSTLISKQGVN